MPYVESHYRTVNDRAHRALAVSRWVGARRSGSASRTSTSSPISACSAPGSATPAGHGSSSRPPCSDNAKLKKGLDLFWVGIGKEDRGLESSRDTVEMFKKHGFNVVSRESEGGHTWLNWRDYLVEFAPKLFQ
jgi:enterochelin esterase family protein